MRELDVVFLHGWGMNQGIWHDFIKLFKQYNTGNVKAIDLPGFGDNSNVSLKAYTVAQISSWLSAQLTKNTLLVGWSMGGLIAQHLINSRHPLVVGHVQIASTPKFEQSVDWPGIKPQVLQSFLQQLTDDRNALLRRFITLQSLGVTGSKSLVKSMLANVSNYPQSSEYVLQQSLAFLTNTDLRASLNIPNSLPTLRIYGVLDALVPKSVIPQIQKLDPSSQTEIISKASHAPFVSHPEHCFQLIDSFIKNNFK